MLQYGRRAFMYYIAYTTAQCRLDERVDTRGSRLLPNHDRIIPRFRYKHIYIYKYIIYLGQVIASPRGVNDLGGVIILFPRHRSGTKTHCAIIYKPRKRDAVYSCIAGTCVQELKISVSTGIYIILSFYLISRIIFPFIVRET